MTAIDREYEKALSKPAAAAAHFESAFYMQTRVSVTLVGITDTPEGMLEKEPASAIPSPVPTAVYTLSLSRGA